MNLKFCGIRRVEDVSYCNVLQPDYMGMILSPGFRRSVSLSQAAVLAARRNERIQAAGVFVDSPIDDILLALRHVSLDVIQLHGSESRETIRTLRDKTGLPVWKAVRVRTAEDISEAGRLGADRLILEGYVSGQAGGTGVTANWNLIADARPETPFFLAGGLKPDNLQEAIRLVQPDGVDFSSGIETDGVKDFEKMKEIIRIIRGESHGQSR